MWYYYFQKTVTQRAEELISKKITSILLHLQEEIVKRLKDTNTLQQDEKICLWSEEISENCRKKGCSGNETTFSGCSFCLKRFVFK